MYSETSSESPFTQNMVKMAKTLSDSAITKGEQAEPLLAIGIIVFTAGQLEVLQHSLFEAENLIAELKGESIIVAVNWEGWRWIEVGVGMEWMDVD